MRQRTRRLVTYGKGASIQSQEHRASGPEAPDSHADIAGERTSAQSPRRPSSRLTRQKERGSVCRTESGSLGCLPIAHMSVETLPSRHDAVEEDKTEFRVKRRRITPGRNSKPPRDDIFRDLHGPPGETIRSPDVTTGLEKARTSEIRSPTINASKTRHGEPTTYSKSPPNAGVSLVGTQISSCQNNLSDARNHSPSAYQLDKEYSISPPHDSNLNSDATPTRRRLVDHLALAENPAAKESRASVESHSHKIGYSSTKWPSAFSSESSDHLNSPSHSRLPHNTPSFPRTSQKLSPQKPTTVRGSKVTYARQRSFLNDVSLMGGDEPLSRMVESSLPAVSVSDIPSYADDSEPNDGVPVRSIHELRQSGDNARFRETVDSIFEEIEDPENGTPERCTGLIQLCEKLLEYQFACRFSEHGFDERLVKNITCDLDVFPASLALCAYRLACDSGSFSLALSSSIWPRLLDLAPAVLNVEEDLFNMFQQRPGLLSRTTRTSLKKLLPKLSVVCGSQATQAVSPQLLILSSIHHTLQELQANGNTVEPLSAFPIGHIVQILSPEAFGTQQPALSSHRSHIFILVFSILETYTVLSDPLDTEQCSLFHPLRHLYGLLYADRATQSRQILDLYIRVILNLTNKDSSLCDVFATPQILSGYVRIITSGFSDVPGHSFDNTSNPLNTVILALGALINLAEKSDSSRATFLTSMHSSVSVLHALLRQFSVSIGFVNQVRTHQPLGFLILLCLMKFLRHIPSPRCIIVLLLGISPSSL